MTKEITKADAIEVSVSVALSFADSGNMSRNLLAGVFENPRELLLVFNTRGVRYLAAQEKGFVHYKSKKLVTKNKGFINEKIAGKLERMVYSNALGIPYNKLEDNQIIIENNHLMMVETGAFKDG